MEEVIEMLSEDPERAAGMAYGALFTTSSAYLAYKNDFGAEYMTTNELDEYIEQTEDSWNPVARYKRRVYNKEVENRDNPV